MLAATRRFLSEDYDRIMADIKHKINMHMHIAVGRIRFIRNNGKDSRGSVEQFIKILRDAMSEIEMKDELSEEMRNLFRLDRNEYIDLASVRYPRKNKSIRKVTTSEVEILSEEDILAAKMQQKQEAYNPYSKDKMKQYMQELIAHKQELHADEIPMGNKDELLAAISAVTYGEENGYDISVEDGYIESNGLLIRRFNVKKK